MHHMIKNKRKRMDYLWKIIHIYIERERKRERERERER